MIQSSQHEKREGKCGARGRGFRQSSFHQYHAGLSVHRSLRLDTITDLLPRCYSLCLSTPGKASDSGIFIRIPPDCVGDTAKRLTAHTGQAWFPWHPALQTCPFTGGPWCHVVAGVGSQGLPVRALWMASMARMWWPRVLTR